MREIAPFWRSTLFLAGSGNAQQRILLITASLKMRIYSSNKLKSGCREDEEKDARSANRRPKETGAQSLSICLAEQIRAGGWRKRFYKIFFQMYRKYGLVGQYVGKDRQFIEDVTRVTCRPSFAS